MKGMKDLRKKEEELNKERSQKGEGKELKMCQV